MKKILSLLVLCWVIAWWYQYRQYQDFKSKKITQIKTIVTIQSWDTFSNIDTLLWVDADHLKTYIRFNTPDFTLQQWSYIIPAEANISQAIDALEFPITDEVNLTF